MKTVKALEDESKVLSRQISIKVSAMAKPGQLSFCLEMASHPKDTVNVQ